MLHTETHFKYPWALIHLNYNMIILLTLYHSDGSSLPADIPEVSQGED